MFTKTPRQKGFTLLELLVVIAIIGILASIVLVSLSQSRQRGTYAQVIQQLHEIESAFRLYLSSAQQWPNTCRSGSLVGSSGTHICSYSSPGVASNDQSDVFYVSYLATGVAPAPNGNTQKMGVRTFPNFNTVMSGVPQSPLPGGFYAYTNTDVVASSNCPNTDNDFAGVYIRIGTNMSIAGLSGLFTYLDTQMDGGDGQKCGRIRYDATFDNVVYLLARSSSDFTY